MREVSCINENTTPVSQLFDPGRLTQARRLRCMTKVDLHRKIGVSATAIGQYERGEVRPRPETIEALAKALNTTPGFFTVGRPRAQLETSEVSFRKLRATSVRQQQQAVAYVEQVWELCHYLEEQVEFPELSLPNWALDEAQEVPDPVTAARLLRKCWNLGENPISNLVFEIERNGILTVFLSVNGDSPDAEARIDAFTTTSLDRPIIVLTPDKANDLMRHRFSTAHELGHVLLHHPQHGDNLAREREADEFASEFLMPETSITGQLPKRVNFAIYNHLSKRWGVSIKSLIYKSRQLGIISESTARRAYITLNKSKFPETSIESCIGEQPQILKEALKLIEQEANISLASVSDSLKITVEDIRNIAGIEDPKPKLRLVSPTD